MSDDTIKITVEGLDKLQAQIDQYPKKVASYMQGAALESLRVVLQTEGIRKYPPISAANRPPAPYYERGLGMWVTDKKNLGNSERYGRSWETARTPYGAKTGNSVSYARYLGGEEQAKHMGQKGWRKLSDVAREKLPEIKQIFQNWVNKLLNDLDLQ